MVHIETINLTSRNVTLPSDRVGMVVAQPYLTLTDTEPYQCTPGAKTRQLTMLADTLAVARAAPHGAPKTHFTIFPEYSIPGLDGIAQIETSLRAGNWPTATIIIGGVDALTKNDFVTLAGAPGTHLNASDNALARVGQNEWINCAVTWVKADDGTVERWLQPKLHPAWPERNVPYQNMFHGNSLFTFQGPLENGTQYRFCSLVCFDWIATVHNQKAWRWVMEHLRQQAAQAQAELSLSWFFVVQCNRKPSDDAFLTEVADFFDQTTLPNVRRDRACLVFANSAGKAAPGRADLYGSTSLVFTRQTLFVAPKCNPTFCNGGSKFRSSTLLSGYHDLLFRERGECIHAFAQINPNSVRAGAAGKAFALENPFVFPLNGIIDPRAPAGLVPACIKWVNDQLDSIPSLSVQYPTAALAGQADTAHERSIAALRAISPQSVAHSVKLAAKESTAEHADLWDRAEAEALEHLVHTLDIIALGYPQPTLGADPAHATAVMNNQTIDLLIIRGNTHDACIKHSESFLPLPRRQVLLISRDRDNTAWRHKYGSILQPNSPQLGQERNFTDPSGGRLHLGYEKLLNIFRNSSTAAAVQGAINAELAA